MLTTGVDVILDWNLWSRERRAIWRDRARAADARPVLHYVRVPLEVAVARAESRRREGDPGSHELDRAAVEHLNTIFETPAESEDLTLIVST